ncbi:Yqey-like protein-domain-containing protein [Globomyces pollinis-pini]|nr:Yqey-like protein-domain-containing protein [Globomyces pollinis-pini]
MRAKDKLKVTVIKSVLADNITAEKSGSDKLPSFSELIQKGIKRRQDSVKEYRSGGRDDLAKSEEDELVILQSFLPKQMSKDELSKIVQETIDKVGAKDVKDLGKLMKVLNSELDVAVVSRKMISDVAKEILSSKSK